MTRLVLLLAVILVSSHDAFTIPPANRRASGLLLSSRHIRPVIVVAARYGPPIEEAPDPQQYDRMRQQQVDSFQELVNQVMVAQPEHIPSLLTKDIELLVSMQRDQIEAILQDAKDSGGEELEQRVADTLELIFGFAESFVGEMKTMDDGNKQLLGKIIKASRKGEDDLDDMLEEEKTSFSPGFLRHLEGECERIANAPSTTPESLKMLQILRTIQARVVEELGKDLGEGALVLGQLLGYDDDKERLAVLQTGLQMRGPDFSNELVKLTERALADFARLGNADPELVERVTGIHQGIMDFIETTQKK